jgi:acetyl-CoA carboxylase biotin carboxyl carrier protein
VPLTAQDVAEIARLLEQSDFIELRIEHEGFKLTLKRGAAAKHESADSAAAASWPAAGSAQSPWAARGTPPPPQQRGEPPVAASDPSLQNVTAPLLGIFYRAPRPGAAPYVEVGSEVAEDTVIGIIEVMKLMNGVRAEVRGTVVEILVEDGATVEYGQVLLRVSRGGESG